MIEFADEVFFETIEALMDRDDAHIARLEVELGMAYDAARKREEELTLLRDQHTELKTQYLALKAEIEANKENIPPSDKEKTMMASRAKSIALAARTFPLFTRRAATVHDVAGVPVEMQCNFKITKH